MNKSKVQSVCKTCNSIKLYKYNAKLVSNEIREIVQVLTYLFFATYICIVWWVVV